MKKSALHVRISERVKDNALPIKGKRVPELRIVKDCVSNRYNTIQFSKMLRITHKIVKRTSVNNN